MALAKNKKESLHMSQNPVDTARAILEKIETIDEIQKLTIRTPPAKVMRFTPMRVLTMLRRTRSQSLQSLLRLVPR